MDQTKQQKNGFFSVSHPTVNYQKQLPWNHVHPTLKIAQITHPFFPTKTLVELLQISVETSPIKSAQLAFGTCHAFDQIRCIDDALHLTGGHRKNACAWVDVVWSTHPLLEIGEVPLLTLLHPWMYGILTYAFTRKHLLNVGKYTYHTWMVWDWIGWISKVYIA